jgi:hypothetical protein
MPPNQVEASNTETVSVSLIDIICILLVHLGGIVVEKTTEASY